jgi:hypothetical protein
MILSTCIRSLVSNVAEDDNYKSPIGINRHDAPLGFISEEDMANVFDKLYKYNDLIDNKKGGGLDQRDVVRRGMDYIREEFPLTDVIHSCIAF